MGVEPVIGVDTKIGFGVLVLLVTVVSNFLAVKFGQQEQQRLLKALHSRFDRLEKDQRELQINHARLDERQKSTERDIQSLMKITQRLRLAQGDAEED